MKFSCDGEPSLYKYSRGCRCDLCKSIKSLYESERRVRARKNNKDQPKKPSGGNRDKPVPEADAFTREQILRARGMEPSNS
jgi:hypothetical protein